MQFWSFFGHDRPFNRADLQTNATVDAGGEVDPIPIGAFGVFARPFVNAGNRAGIDAISDPFTDIGNDRMRHKFFPTKYLSKSTHWEHFIMAKSEFH